MEQCQKSLGFIAIFYNSIFFHKTQKMHHQKSQLSNIEWRRRQRRWEEEEKEGKNVLEDRERCANWTNIGASLLFQSKLKGSFIFGRFISKANINMLSYSMLDALSSNCQFIYWIDKNYYFRGTFYRAPLKKEFGQTRYCICSLSFLDMIRFFGFLLLTTSQQLCQSATFIQKLGLWVLLSSCK